MNYYEELGVERDAGVEQIHRAYRTLARLVHPDGQEDEQLRAMAGRQMARLNEILATLTDAARRREYDRRLACEEHQGGELRVYAAPAGMRIRRRPAAGADLLRGILKYWHFVLLAVGLIIVLVVAWHEAADQMAQPASVARADSEPVPAVRSQPPKPGAMEPLQRWPNAPRSGSKSTAALFCDEAAKPAPMSSGESGSAAASGSATAVQPRWDAAPIPVPGRAGEPPASAETAEQRLTLAGNWFYTPEFGEKADAGAYPAQYIEFILVEDKGNLVGNYRARYKVLDRAVASEINFRAYGRSQNVQTARLTWISTDGAKGEIELSLRSPNLMRMIWWTSEFGARAALASGEALLVRQRQTR